MRKPGIPLEKITPEVEKLILSEVEEVEKDIADLENEAT